MRKRSILYFILVILATVLVSFQGGAFFYALFFTVLLYLPLSLIYAALSFHFLHIWQALPDIHVKKGEACDYRLVLENTSPFPIPVLFPVYREEVFLLKKAPKQFSLDSRGRIELHLTGICLYAGTYPIGISHFILRDCLGLFSFRFRVAQDFRAIALPLITDTADKSLLDRMQRGDAFLPNPLADESFSNDYRSYSPGDRINRIAWRLYARTGELMVRKREPEEIEEVTLQFIAEKKPETLSEIQIRDRFLEFSVSAVLFFLKQERPVRVLWQKGKEAEDTIHSMRDFNRFYRDISEHLRGTEEEPVSPQGQFLRIREEEFA